MNRIYLTLILVVLGFCAFSQQPSGQVVRGTVLDMDSKLPLPGVNIQIAGTNSGTSTDANGNFRLTNVSLGRQSFIVSFIGYNSKTLNDILISSGKETVLTIELQESVTSLKEVSITATVEKSKAQNEMAVISVRTFSIEETERYAGSLGDPSRMAKNFAGVSTGDDERNDIIIRGNSPIGLLWRLDGFNIPNPSHFGAMGTTGGAISMLNNNLLSNSDFFSSAFPAEYANATSGVFDLKMRNGNNEKHEFMGQVGFNGFELGAEGPISKKNKSSFIVNYRYSMLSLLNMMGLEVGKKSSTPRYQDLSFKMNFPVKKGYISIFGIGGLDRLETTKDTTKRDTIQNNTGVIGVTFVRFLSNKTRIEVKSSIQYAQSKNYEYRYFKPDYMANFQETKFTFSVFEKTKINAKNNISFGVNFTRDYLDFSDSSFTTRTDENGDDINYWEVLRDTRGSMSLLTAFGQWKHNFSNNLSMSSGLNFLYLDYNQSYNVEPRLGLSYEMSEKHAINMGFGIHSQTQASIVYLSESYDSNGIAYNSNKNLGLSKSIHGVLGYDLNISKQMRLKLETYYQHLFNIPISQSSPIESLINSGADFEIIVPDSLVNKATGKNYGVEITLEKFFQNNYYFLVTSSLFQSKYYDYNGVERNTAFNNNFVLNGLFGYELPVGIEKQNRITFNFRGTYAGGNPKLEIDLQKSIAQNRKVINWENAYEKRNPNYFRMDVRIGFKHNKKKFSQEFAIDIQNVTNHNNVLKESYDKKNKVVETEYQMGLFPMALYRINF